MERLTAEDIEAIRKRAEAATEGPWYYNEKWSYLAPTIPQKSVCVITNDITRSEDADFIANARTDIPALLAEVERLRETVLDFAEHGTRHDTHPTIGGRIKSACDISGWLKYIRSMDDGVKARAKEALSDDE